MLCIQAEGKVHEVHRTNPFSTSAQWSSSKFTRGTCTDSLLRCFILNSFYCLWIKSYWGVCYHFYCNSSVLWCSCVIMRTKPRLNRRWNCLEWDQKLLYWFCGSPLACEYSTMPMLLSSVRESCLSAACICAYYAGFLCRYQGSNNGIIDVNITKPCGLWDVSQGWRGFNRWHECQTSLLSTWVGAHECYSRTNTANPGVMVTTYLVGRHQFSICWIRTAGEYPIPLYCTHL